jgi:hypothetical protein
MKYIENALSEWLRTETTKYFPRTQSARSFFGFEFSFQNCFWNLFSFSGLSQICKIRNTWQLTRPFSRNTLISSSEKTFRKLKTSFLKKNCPINSKMVMKNFFDVRLLKLFLISKKSFQSLRLEYTLRTDL